MGGSPYLEQKGEDSDEGSEGAETQGVKAPVLAEAEKLVEKEIAAEAAKPADEKPAA